MNQRTTSIDFNRQVMLLIGEREIEVEDRVRVHALLTEWQGEWICDVQSVEVFCVPDGECGLWKKAPMLSKAEVEVIEKLLAEQAEREEEEDVVMEEH